MAYPQIRNFEEWMQAKYFDPSMGPLMRTAIEYSFIATCKAAGIEPREWFEDVIRIIPEYENGKTDVTHLLPKNWKANSKNFNQR